MSKEETGSIKLKPILNIQPGIYLTFLYSFLLLLVIFCIFFLHGIIYHGSILKIYSNVSDSKVFIDGVLVGRTPYSGFVKSGERNIKIEHDYFGTQEIKYKVKGRYFFTLIRIPREKINVNLQVQDEENYIKNIKEDIYTASFLEESKESGIIEGSIFKYLKNLYSDTHFKDSNESAKQILYFSLLNLSNQFLIEDFASALFVYANDGFEYKEGFYEKILKFLSDIKYDKNALCYAENQIFKKNNKCENQNIDKNIYFYENNQKTQYNNKKVFPEVVYGAHKFIKLNKSEFAENLDQSETFKNFIQSPKQITLESFYIGETEITNADFQEFLKEMPIWSLENKANLIKNNLIDENYLFEFENSKDIENFAKYPVVSISYYAAKEFAKWFSKKYLPQGITARLPTKEELELSYRIFEVKNDTNEITNMKFTEEGSEQVKNIARNVWELTLSPYFMLNRVFEININENDIFGIVLKGGSFLNFKKEVSGASEGVQGTYETSNFTGFRLVLEK